MMEKKETKSEEAGGPTAPTPTPPDAAAPAAAEAESARKSAELEDRYKRALAELANTHKRYQRDRENVGRLAVAAFVKELLTVVDNLSRSLKAAPTAPDVAAVVEGVRLVEAQMLQVLAGHGIRPIESEGKPFDPAVHHAVMMDVTDRVPPGTVTEEVGRGFVMNDLVIRPAQVKVAAAPPRKEVEPKTGKK